LVTPKKLVGSDAARDVAWGQLSFAIFITVCVALHPHAVLKANEGGISDYGVRAKTVVPYTLALGLPSVLTYVAARHLHVVNQATQRLRAVLVTYWILLALTLLSTYPYTLDRTLTDVHVAVGIAITVFETVASLWMCVTLRGYRAVLAAQLAGLVLAGLAITGTVHVLFLSEVISAAAFAVLLVRTTQRLN
jgi:hypothetical protein